MNYTLNQLRVFAKVVENESVTKASEVLHMTQPAVSIQLKKFQDQFEIPLTEIIGKRLYVTEFGRTIAEIAKNILSESEALQYKTKEFKGLLTGTLRIASASTGKYVMPYFLSAFSTSNPNVNLILDVSNKEHVVQGLKNNEIDFALVSVLPTDVEVHEELLVENKLFLVSSREKIDSSKPLIFREKGSATRMAMDTYYGEKSRQKSIELTSNEAVKQAVISGLGYSILPLIGIKNELSNGELHIIPTKGLPVTTQWRLIWLKQKKLSPVSEAYLDFLRNHKDEIIHEKFDWYDTYEHV
ncbi:MAG: LysR family transcriptional regulator [Bacteroidetes bacterium]|nr:MAG: LysR family transcriptional regulator [Bacteroidota bacterium]